jgi:hypothetical protein
MHFGFCCAGPLDERVFSFRINSGSTSSNVATRLPVGPFEAVFGKTLSRWFIFHIWVMFVGSQCLVAKMLAKWRKLVKIQILI